MNKIKSKLMTVILAAALAVVPLAVFGTATLASGAEDIYTIDVNTLTASANLGITAQRYDSSDTKYIEMAYYKLDDLIDANTSSYFKYSDIQAAFGVTAEIFDVSVFYRNDATQTLPVRTVLIGGEKYTEIKGSHGVVLVYCKMSVAFYANSETPEPPKEPNPDKPGPEKKNFVPLALGGGLILVFFSVFYILTNKK